MSNTNQMTTVPQASQESGHNYEGETETIFDLIARLLIEKDQTKAAIKSANDTLNRNFLSVTLQAIIHCQKFGDVRPLGRVVCQLKPGTRFNNMIRLICPELINITQVAKDNFNDFNAPCRNGKTTGNMEFDQDLIDHAIYILEMSTKNQDTIFNKEYGFADAFPDNSPINKEKKIKSVKKSIIKTMVDLKKKGGGNLTKAEWTELVNTAYAEFQQAQSAAPSPEDH